MIGRTGKDIDDSSLIDKEQYKKGNWLYSYDPSGNMTRAFNSHKNIDVDRKLYWDEENRLKKVTEKDGTKTTFQYDPDGERIVKNGEDETIYVTPSYTVRNNEVEGVHIFAGNTRIASKINLKSKDGITEGIYYYASDHLGSSSVITDRDGNYYEHTEYFPYGEVWVNERTEAVNYDLPYKYTGKEYDSETKLTYFGARYYDAQLSRWISVDPPLISGEYLPKAGSFEFDAGSVWSEENQKAVQELPGQGGVYTPININAYQFAANNPVRYVDPDGNAWTETMWWLAGVDGPLPVGDIVYAAGVAAELTTVACIAYDKYQSSSKAVPMDIADSKRESQENIPLFRAVKPEEYAQIKATGRFMNVEGIEGKYFSGTPEGAKQYAKMAEESFGDESYMLIGTSIPKDQLSPEMMQAVDRGIPAIVVPTEKLHTLTTPVDMGKANEK